MAAGVSPRVMAVSADSSKLRAGRRAGAPRVFQAVRDLQDALRGLPEAAGELLLEQIPDLLRGHVSVTRLLTNGCTVKALP